MQSHWIMLLPQIYKFTITLYTTIGTASTVSDAWGPQLDSRQTDKPKCHIERGREGATNTFLVSVTICRVSDSHWKEDRGGPPQMTSDRYLEFLIPSHCQYCIHATFLWLGYKATPFLPLLMSFEQGSKEGMAEGALSPLRLEEGIRSMDWMVWQDGRRRSSCMIPAARNWAYLQNWLMLLSHSTPKYTNLWLML